MKLIMVMPKFQIMTIRSLDLNLLRVFDAMARRGPRPLRARYAGKGLIQYVAEQIILRCMSPEMAQSVDIGEVC